MRKLLLAGLVAALSALGLALPAPAGAITGGEPDTAHPEVGMLLWVGHNGVRSRCSGTLVSPRVVVTAAHCVDDVADKVVVTFASPATIPPKPATGGYTSAPAGYVIGRPVPHPLWTGSSTSKDLFDTGLVVLDEPVTTITPAPLVPSAGYLDTVAEPTLKSQLFAVVGYGSRYADAQGEPQLVSGLTRRATTSPLQQVVGQVIKLAQSDDDARGGGGSCSGDSGGAAYWNGYLVGDTSFAANQLCQGFAGYQRLDSPEVYGFVREAILANG